MKRTAILILSALIVISAVGCKKIETKNTAEANPSPQTSENENENENKKDKEDVSEPSKPDTTHKKIYITKPSDKSSDSDVDVDDSSSSKTDSEKNDDSDNNDNDQDRPETNQGSYEANALYKDAIQMYEKVLHNCPYRLDYDDTDANGFAAISDPSVTEIDDIVSLYCTVFDEPDNYIYERYSESDGKVYFNDASRGTNIYYTGTDLEYVSGDEDKMTFNAVSHYSDPDTGEVIENRTASFSIAMTDDGYRITEFDYPK